MWDGYRGMATVSSERTTITAHPETRDRIRALKRGQESYDSVLQRLLDEADLEPEIPQE